MRRKVTPNAMSDTPYMAGLAQSTRDGDNSTIHQVVQLILPKSFYFAAEVEYLEMVWVYS